jgi:hypothetical protein
MSRPDRSKEKDRKSNWLSVDNYDEESAAWKLRQLLFVVVLFNSFGELTNTGYQRWFTKKHFQPIQFSMSTTTATRVPIPVQLTQKS